MSVLRLTPQGPSTNRGPVNAPGPVDGPRARQRAGPRVLMALVGRCSAASDAGGGAQTERVTQQKMFPKQAHMTHMTHLPYLERAVVGRMFCSSSLMLSSVRSHQSCRHVPSTMRSAEPCARSHITMCSRLLPALSCSRAHVHPRSPSLAPARPLPRPRPRPCRTHSALRFICLFAAGETARGP